MDFRPFVNQGGTRVVRWHRLVFVWIFILSATLFGSCTMGYLLTGDWRFGAFLGLVMGVVCSTVFTAFGLATPVDKLPLLPPRSPSGAYRT